MAPIYCLQVLRHDCDICDQDSFAFRKTVPHLYVCQRALLKAVAT